MTDHGPQPVERELPTEEARDLLSLVRELTQREIRPRAAEEEAAGRFPRELFTLLSESGLLGLPYPEEFGGGDQPYEVYLQVLEELAAARLTVGLGVSVHTLVLPRRSPASAARSSAPSTFRPCSAAACSARTACPSPPPAPTPPPCTPAPPATATTWTLDGTKAWITHGGVADFYTVLARTGAEGTARHHARSSCPATPRGSPPPRPSARWA